MSTFGQNLRRIRLLKNMTQDEFAALLGTTKQVISRYENDQRSPKVSVVGEYARLLDVSIGELSGEERPTPSNDPPTTLTDEKEEELLIIYRGLNAAGQNALLKQARYLNDDPDMKKGLESNDVTA